MRDNSGNSLDQRPATTSVAAAADDHRRTYPTTPGQARFESPSSFEAPMNTALTALTVRGSSSGVSSLH